ncbi:polynucleotide kinase [Gordonia phage Syleon]|uniref:Polynucleotide kinase n=1 Tax=Gordonia phage Syleon TaxID=2653718 RepID=A0A5Q2WEM5_9CAUD|nr:polynucleotide kinase [Gordonia phage Syleon]QGH75818.1 polynucleotide kinase [Gordonia phage Syleon]
MTFLVAMRGLPGSGKTTRARQMAKETGAIVVGRDFERFQMFGEWWTGRPEDEDAVTIALEAKVRALLKAGKSVVVDNTHIQLHYLKQWAKVASECGATFHVEDVKTPAETCLFRDMQRQANGERWVGEDVINRMAKQINWGQVKPVPPIIVEPLRYQETPWDADAAIIVDIDGTLAHMREVNGTVRSPYDYSRVHEDAADPTIVSIVYDYKNALNGTVIVCSGRDDDCRDVTEQWLKSHNIPFDMLLMRPEDARDANGNKLPDWIVKYNLFNEHIRGQYAIDYVLDDRNQVVNMWRALGLKCLQVQPGDF